MEEKDFKIGLDSVIAASRNERYGKDVSNIPGLDVRFGEAHYKEYTCPAFVIREHLDMSSYKCSEEDAARMLIQTYGYTRHTQESYKRVKLLQESSINTMRQISKDTFVNLMDKDPYVLMCKYVYNDVNPSTEENFIDYVLSMYKKSTYDGFSDRVDVSDISDNAISLANGHKIFIGELGNTVEEYFMYNAQDLPLLILKYSHSDAGKVDYIKYFVFANAQQEFDLSGFSEAKEDTQSADTALEDNHTEIHCRFYADAEMYLKHRKDASLDPNTVDLYDMFIETVADKLHTEPSNVVFSCEPESGIDLERPTIEGLKVYGFRPGDCVTYIAKVREDKLDSLDEKAHPMCIDADFRIRKNAKGRILTRKTFTDVAKLILEDLDKRSGSFCIKDSEGEESSWELDRDGTNYTLIEKNDKAQNVFTFVYWMGVLRPGRIEYR